MRVTTLRSAATLGLVVRAALLCAALAASGPARAQAPDSVFLEDLTSAEVRDLVAAGATSVIVPIGGTEQNGPHMALGKHNARARILSERIARGLGRTLVAPVIAYVPEGRISPPTGHMRWPGTISVPEDVFQKTIEAAARSFRQHGFRDVVFLGDHGSTQAGQRAVAARLNREWAGGPARAHSIDEYYRASEADFARLLAGRGYRREELGTHAGLVDTSLMLALDPRLVRVDRLRAGTGLGEGGDGVDGDPRRAAPELGRLGVEVIVPRTVEAIRKSLAAARAPR